MESNYRRFLLAVTAAVVIATSAGLVIADNHASAKLVVADTQFSDEPARTPAVSVEDFFYLHQGEYAMAEYLQGL